MALNLQFQTEFTLATSIICVTAGFVLTTYALVSHFALVQQIRSGETDYVEDGVGIWIVSAVAVGVAAVSLTLVFKESE